MFKKLFNSKKKKKWKPYSMYGVRGRQILKESFELKAENRKAEEKLKSKELELREKELEVKEEKLKRDKAKYQQEAEEYLETSYEDEYEDEPEDDTVLDGMFKDLMSNIGGKKKNDGNGTNRGSPQQIGHDGENSPDNSRGVDLSSAKARRSLFGAANNKGGKGN